MADNNWDLDDLLDFQFDRKVPEKNDEFSVVDQLKKMPETEEPSPREDSFDALIKSYRSLRHSDEAPQSPSEAPAAPETVKASGSPQTSGAPGSPRTSGAQKDQKANAVRSGEAPVIEEAIPKYDYSGYYKDRETFARYNEEYEEYQSPLRAPVEEPDEPVIQHGAKEIEAIKHASQEAIDRYRSNYTKKKKKEQRAAARNVSRLDRILSRIYVIALAVFIASMTIMNVLPLYMAAILYGLLALVSLLILRKTRKSDGKRWSRNLARVAAVLLIVFYGVGTAYSLGTLSFLSGTSVDNDSAVSDITRKPFNFVITGIDVDGKIDEEGRSDVNMVVTVNPTTHQILMTSIPRDYEVYMPDYDNAMDKLTHTGFYGVKTTIGAEEQLFDTKVNYYVKVNFTTVERFIDAVGGVDVESEYEFTPVKLKDWTVQKGMNHMNGKQALAFARERKAFPSGDNQRIKNQQLVFEALIKKATSSRTMILNYNNVLSSLRDYFEMSFSSREVRRLVKMQLALNPEWKIFKNTVVGGDGMLPTYSTGGEYAYVMTQDPESIENAKTLMNAVLDGQDLQTGDDGIVTVVPGE